MFCSAVSNIKAPESNDNVYRQSKVVNLKVRCQIQEQISNHHTKMNIGSLIPAGVSNEIPFNELSDFLSYPTIKSKNQIAIRVGKTKLPTCNV